MTDCEIYNSLGLKDWIRLVVKEEDDEPFFLTCETSDVTLFDIIKQVVVLGNDGLPAIKVKQ